MAGAGLARAQMMLTALAQRARADVAVLEPPPLLPGAVAAQQMMVDPEQGKYMWLCERPQRMDAINASLAAVDSAATRALMSTSSETDAPTALRADAIAMLVAEERRERLCEASKWEPLLVEWLELRELDEAAHAFGSHPGSSGGTSAGHSSPPRLRLHPESPPSGKPSSGAPIKRQMSFKRRGGGTSRTPRDEGGLASMRLPFLRTDAEFPWVDQIAADYGLEFGARNRAVGVAREMAAAGYTAQQARAVILGMLHGARERLSDAWLVFVPGGADAVLSRAEWHAVLGMLTGGLGMSAVETDQLFSVFDADGSGSLDFDEFCRVLDALPLQRTVADTPLGSALSALNSLLVLRGQLLQRLSIEQLAEAGRIISRLRTAGFDNEQAARVVQAIYLSRSREALRDAWDVLRSATEATGSPTSGGGFTVGFVSGIIAGGGKSGGAGKGGKRGNVGSSGKSRVHRGGGGSQASWDDGVSGGSMDLEQFARLLPMLGDDLPLSRVERLFEEVDIDQSGEVDFDEFVTFIRRLKPKGKVRNNADACLSAFEAVTNVRSGRPKTLRRAVPQSRRVEAGTLVLTLRDLGYDDEQILSVLPALYPVHAAASAARSPGKDTNDSSRTDSIRVSGSGSQAQKLAVVRGAWTALGGGELVRLPANPFDFQKREGGRAALTANEEEMLGLVALADRWQCASGIEAVSFMDLLALFAEALRMPAGWPPEVTAPVHAVTDTGQRELSFAVFCRVMCELRIALDTAAAASRPNADEGAGTGTGSLLSEPLKALRGATHTDLSDESFANPLRRLVSGGAPRSASGRSASGRGSGPADCLCGLDVDTGLASLQATAERVRQDVQTSLVEPVVEMTESQDPLRFVLDKSLRERIPEWHMERIGMAVRALRKNDFSSREVNVLVAALYLNKAGDADGADVALHAWRVLRHHASRFLTNIERVNQMDKGGAKGSGGGKTVQIWDDKSFNERGADGQSFSRTTGGMSFSFSHGTSFRSFRSVLGGADEVPVHLDDQYDHLNLDAESCRRMLWLLCSPLMKQPQLEALFSAFDVNRDGAISPAELERLMRILDPHRRLARLRPMTIVVPTVLDTAIDTVATATRPAVERMQDAWRRLNPFGKAAEDGDDHVLGD